MKWSQYLQNLQASEVSNQSSRAVQSNSGNRKYSFLNDARIRLATKKFAFYLMKKKVEKVEGEKIEIFGDLMHISCQVTEFCSTCSFNINLPCVQTVPFR